MTRLEDYELWAMARINARRLFYGPVDLTLAAKYSANTAKLILTAFKDKPSSMVHFALSNICGFTGDKVLDINPTLKKEVQDYLEKSDAAEAAIKSLNEVVEVGAENSKQVLGDSLPIGLEI